MKYTCPVCYYADLEEAPADFEICPACGTEFDYQDAATTPSTKRERWELLRRQWLESGAKWFDPATPRPVGWDLHLRNLRNQGY